MKKLLLLILAISALYLYWNYREKREIQNLLPEEAVTPKETAEAQMTKEIPEEIMRPEETLRPQPKVTISAEDLTPEERVVDDSYFIGKQIILYNLKGKAWEGVISRATQDSILINSSGVYRDFGTDKVTLEWRNPGERWVGKGDINFLIYNLTLYAYDKETNKFYYLEYETQ